MTIVTTQITSTGLKGTRKVMKSWGRAMEMKVHMRKQMKDGPRRSVETLLCVSMRKTSVLVFRLRGSVFPRGNASKGPGTV